MECKIGEIRGFRLTRSLLAGWAAAFGLVLSAHGVHGQMRVLDSTMYHLRSGDGQEWSEFPAEAAVKQLDIPFEGWGNDEPAVLRIRQRDVRQDWQVRLNGESLGALIRDEKDMVVYFNIPPGKLLAGSNTISISPADTLMDDILAGELMIYGQAIGEVLSEAKVQIGVRDADSGQPLPCRITVVNAQGALQTTGKGDEGADKRFAVRPGYIYTGHGSASFGLPAGTYTVYATRGFEYGVDSVQLTLKPGERISKQLVIRREVPTAGWISSDTHIHTYTYSGHGDATPEERALSIAGEGIELPVMTEHNAQVDLSPAAASMQVHTFFTPVTGNEVTTRVGHFNVFPLPAGGPLPAAKAENWEAVSLNLAEAEISAADKAVILNHARDFHSGFRPFGEERHLAIAGWNLDGWKLPANSMEVINSGALKTDKMRLYADWFGMLNRGYLLTPVGSSDSHDVSRYLLGQARTYIRSRSEDPAQIDIAEAIDNFREGRVMVSFGLLAEITVDSVYGPGDVVPVSGETRVAVRVSGPSWVKATRVSLYANGKKIREAEITDGGDAAGIKWNGVWTLSGQEYDVFLVAIAEGPAPNALFWPVPKPYQPDSPSWDPYVVGSTGAVWIDADRDGRYTSPYGYAKRLSEAVNSAALKSTEDRPGGIDTAAQAESLDRLIEKLRAYDEAVAIQVAVLLYEHGVALSGPHIDKALQKASPATRSGFRNFLKAAGLSEEAR